MPESTAPRPTQVTIAAWLVMSGSVVVVLTAFDQIAGLRSVETREAVEEFLGTPFGEWSGLGVQGTLSLIRVLTMVAAACATAAGILGYQVLRRSRSARLVLTLLAAPLFLAGVVVGGFLPSIIVGSIVMLWFQPARDWIDGKTPRAATAPSAPTAPRGGSSAPASCDPGAASIVGAARVPRLRCRAWRARCARRSRRADCARGVPGGTGPAGPSTGADVGLRAGLGRQRGRVHGDARQRGARPGRARHAGRRALPPEPGAAERRDHPVDPAVDRPRRGHPRDRLVGGRLGVRRVRLAWPALGLDGAPGLGVLRDAAVPARRPRQPGDARAAGPVRSLRSPCCCAPRCGASCGVARHAPWPTGRTAARDRSGGSGRPGRPGAGVGSAARRP